MADVKICDRCGEKLIANCFVSLSPVRYFLEMEIEQHFTLWDRTTRKRYDLCKNCKNKLIKFLENEEDSNGDTNELGN